MRSRLPQGLRRQSAHILTGNNQMSGRGGLRQTGFAAPSLHDLRAPSQYLARAVKADFRPRIGVLFAVPELHAFNRAPLAGQIELGRFSARANAIGNSKLLLCAIPEMDDQALQIDGAATYTHLNFAKLACPVAHMNGFVVLALVDVRGAEQDPMLGLRDWRH